MRRGEWLAVVAVFGMGVAVGACGSGSVACTAANCAGCCSAAGECVPGRAVSACGSAGAACGVCQGTQTCDLGVCRGSVDGGSGGGSTGGGSGGGGGMSSAVVINEVYGAGNNVGTDYVELFNAGTAAADLSGFSVTDTDTSDGGPKPREGVVFPSGTSLAAGAHLLVVGDRNDAGVSTACLGSVSSCFEARFGISQANGETMFLLDAQGAIVATAVYPANGAPGPQSYGRLPDGTGTFRAMNATPGITNQP